MNEGEAPIARSRPESGEGRANVTGAGTVGGFEDNARVSGEEALAGDLDRGLSLPASWYTDPELVTRERDRIFRRAWQYLGRVEQVARVGDFVTGGVADVP